MSDRVRVLLLLVLIGVLIAVVVLLSPWAGKEPEEGMPLDSRPEVLAIEFPNQIHADGQKVSGTVRFRDPDADIVEVRFEVVKARIFNPFAFDPGIRGQKEGSLSFFVFTYFPQEVILHVTLIDAQSHTSDPVEFSFEAVFPDEEKR